MKTILYVIIFSFSINSFSQQTGIFEIDYVKYFEIDENKFYESSSSNPDRDVVERNKRNFTEEENYTLICDENESLFNYNAKLNNSQTESEVFESKGNKTVFHNNSGLVLYRNLTNKIYMLPNGKKTIIQDSLYNFNWNTNYDDEREILGYKVKKATAKGLEVDTEITAWYTPEINISNGPYLYWGLPGLILEVDINVYSNVGLAYFINSYHFKAQKITKLDSNEKLNPDLEKKKIMTPEELQQKKEIQRQKEKEYLGGGVDKD